MQNEQTEIGSATVQHHCARSIEDRLDSKMGGKPAWDSRQSTLKTNHHSTDCLGRSSEVEGSRRVLQIVMKLDAECATTTQDKVSAHNRQRLLHLYVAHRLLSSGVCKHICNLADRSLRALCVASSRTLSVGSA